MSRSRRKSPYLPHTSAKSDKFDKQKAARRFRAASKVDLLDEAVIVPSKSQHVTNPYTFAKDGRYRIDPATNPELMRK